MGAAQTIQWLELALFLLVLTCPLALNFKYQLNLAKESLIAITRMSVQLILVGLYLKFLFELNSLWLNLIWLGVMLLVGASAIVSKAKLPKRPLLLPVLSGLLLGTLPILGLILIVLLQPIPWYNTQYLIPLAGMLLGNSLSGNIVALQRFFLAFKEQRAHYEGALSLGATPQQAALPFMQQAIRQSMAPTLASMTTAGLVSLPGMMTGQILGGSDPMVAIQYQLLIMVAIFVSLSLSVTSCLQLILSLKLTASGRLLIPLQQG